MIPKNIYTNENITKIPTPSPISPYLQTIVINNKPLTPITIINMYMPTHPQDTHLIREIQNQIQLLITQHPNHQIILAGDFNRDILLKGRTSNGTHLPPNQNDLEWAHFTNNIGLITINNQHNHTRQGGLNYTSTSHIDGFYSNLPNHNHLTCYTLDNLNQNSDHYPVQLNLHPNSIVIKEPHPHTSNPRITYPIHPANFQKLQTTFMETQSLAIATLTTTLQKEQLTHTQWENAQNKFQEIINSLSTCIEQTCMTHPKPPLPNRVKIQGGFLPRTQQKLWKHQLKIHHGARKAIHAACQNPHAHLHNHPNIKALQLIKNINIPPLPTNPTGPHNMDRRNSQHR